MIMDISSAQSNATLLDAVSAQTQQVSQSNRPTTSPPVAQQQPSAEVTLSRDARERANQPPAAPQPATSNVGSNPVQEANKAQPAANEKPSETSAAQTRENQNREQQANAALQAQAVAPTYTARLAAQSYTNVSNF
jgi:hypothetical protein